MLAAQQTPKVNKNLYLTTSLGYGTENNEGNTAFYAGIAVAKEIKRKLLVEAGLTYFTTAIYNVYKAKPTNFDGEERFYNALFLNTNLQYLIGNDKSLINIKIKAGPALRYFDFKVFKSGLIKSYPDGRDEPVPGTIKYDIEESVGLSFYSAVSFDAKVTPKLRMGVYLDTYSGLIEFEYFMPGIYATFKLGKKK